jgi:hypothetical protein
MTAPERLWVDAPAITNRKRHCAIKDVVTRFENERRNFHTEYTRTDLFDAHLAEVTALRAERDHFLRVSQEQGVWVDRAKTAEAEVARLRAALQMIADGRGKCSECGILAVGEGAGCVGCDRHYCRWEAQDPQEIARAALTTKDTP